MTEPLDPTNPQQPNPDETLHLDRRTGLRDGLGRRHRLLDIRRLEPVRASPPAARAPRRRSSIRSGKRSTTWPGARRPTVREFSARAAEFAADDGGQGRAASPSAPARLTADASGKLAERSRLVGTRSVRAASCATDAGSTPARTPEGRAGRAGPTSRGRGSPSRHRLTSDSATGRADRAAPILRRMSVRPIVLLGDPRLRLVGEPVDSFGRFLHELLDDLAHTMRDAPGVGLAAPQLGEAAAGLRHRGRGPAARAGEPEDRPVHR